MRLEPRNGFDDGIDLMEVLRNTKVWTPPKDTLLPQRWYKGESGDALKLGMISNAGDGQAIRQFIERNDLEGYFETIIISEEVGLAKPWKRIFEMALWWLHLDSDHFSVVALNRKPYGSLMTQETASLVGTMLTTICYTVSEIGSSGVGLRSGT